MRTVPPVIPGSHKWEDFGENGTSEDAIPAEMEAGDAVTSLSSFSMGEAIMGPNALSEGALHCFPVLVLHPEEAYPFLIDKEMAKTITPWDNACLDFALSFGRTVLEYGSGIMVKGTRYIVEKYS